MTFQPGVLPVADRGLALDDRLAAALQRSVPTKSLGDGQGAAHIQNAVSRSLNVQVVECCIAAEVYASFIDLRIRRMVVRGIEGEYAVDEEHCAAAHDNSAGGENGTEPLPPD